MLLVVREAWGHMDAQSGFDPFFGALQSVAGADRVAGICVPGTRRPSLIERCLYKLRAGGDFTNSRPNSPFVERRHEWIAPKILRKAEAFQNSLILLSAGENQFGIRLSRADKAIRNRMLVCLHQPPSWLRMHWRDFSDLNGLRAVITLCKEQRQFLSRVCNSPIILIRHGVCHKFFRPLSSRREDREPRLLFVGQWLRDFSTLSSAMKLIWAENPSVQLDCVIPRFARSQPELLRLAADDRVHWHADISAFKLCELYQHSTLLLLPLIDGTANNAVMEALSCGLPVISTRVGGMPDYIPAGAGQLCARGSAWEHAAAVMKWMSNDELRREGAVIARRTVETMFTWDKIAAEFLREIDYVED
jgi:glycosyltransferase involved in cell wall biosynthesis